MFGEIFRRRAAKHPERIGCPVAAAALARPEDPALAAAATAAFQSWEEPIAAALATKASTPSDAETFAGLVVSTVEGALVRARAAGDQAPLDSAVAGLRAGARRAARRPPRAPTRDPAGLDTASQAGTFKTAPPHSGPEARGREDLNDSRRRRQSCWPALALASLG